MFGRTWQTEDQQVCCSIATETRLGLLRTFGVLPQQLTSRVQLACQLKAAPGCEMLRGSQLYPVFSMVVWQAFLLQVSETAPRFRLSVRSRESYKADKKRLV